MKNTRRFTLIELLAVVALIAVLSALGFGGYSYAKGKARESATEALLKQIEAGLENFHTKNGYYPKSKNGNFTPIRFTFNSDGTVESVIFSDTDSSSTDKFTKLTFNANPTNKKQRMENELLASFTKALDLEVLKNSLNSSGEVIDAWGEKPVYYRSPGVFKPGGYDLISAGADGVFSKKTDNNDKPVGDLTDYREKAGEHLCDDLFNF